MELIRFTQVYNYSDDLKIQPGETFVLSENSEWYISEFRKDPRVWIKFETVNKWLISQGIVTIIDE